MAQRAEYKLTLRKLNAQLALSRNDDAEYVPLSFRFAVVAVDRLALDGLSRISA